MPFVVVDTVRITDIRNALEGLHSQIVPAVKQAPGFVRGAWSRISRATVDSDS